MAFVSFTEVVRSPSSQGNASVIRRATHSAVGFAVTLIRFPGRPLADSRYMELSKESPRRRF
jgi:hypothetical protein